MTDEMVNDIDLTEVAVEQPAEKMLSQSEVNKIVARQKQQAAEKARRKAEQEFQGMMEQQNAQPTLEQQPNVAEPHVDPDALYQQIQERFNSEMQQRQLEQEMSTVADNYLSKMAGGKEIYDDFDEVTGNFEPAAFPQLVYLVSGIDNAADVVYELANNPSKLVTIDTLAQRSPKAAQAELQKLSRSISENRAAQSDQANSFAPAPLDRVNPSRNTGNNAKMGISDLRNQPWLRG